MKVPEKKRMSLEEVAERYDKLIRKTYGEIAELVGAQFSGAKVNVLECSGLISFGIFTFMVGLMELHLRTSGLVTEKVLKEKKD